MITVEFDEKASAFIKEKSVSSFFLDVLSMEESCVHLYSPIIRLKLSNLDKNIKKIDSNGIKIFISDSFSEYFGTYENLLISTNGLIRKQLFVKNVEPIIKNVCKI